MLDTSEKKHRDGEKSVERKVSSCCPFRALRVRSNLMPSRRMMNDCIQNNARTGSCCAVLILEKLVALDGVVLSALALRTDASACTAHTKATRERAARKVNFETSSTCTRTYICIYIYIRETPYRYKQSGHGDRGPAR